MSARGHLRERRPHPPTHRPPCPARPCRPYRTSTPLRVPKAPRQNRTPVPLAARGALGSDGVRRDRGTQAPGPLRYGRSTQQRSVPLALASLVLGSEKIRSPPTRPSSNTVCPPPERDLVKLPRWPRPPKTHPASPYESLGPLAEPGVGECCCANGSASVLFRRQVPLDPMAADGLRRSLVQVGPRADVAAPSAPSGSAEIGVVFIPNCQQGVPKSCQLTAALCPRRASIPDIDISIDFIAGGIGG
jgi:hypothetical protein